MIFKRIKETLNQPYPFDNDLQYKIKTSLIVCLIVFLVLNLLQPFGIEENGNVFSISLTYCLIILVIILIHKIPIQGLFPKYYSEENWKISNEIIENVLYIFSISFVNMLISKIVYHERFTISEFIEVIFGTTIVGIVPITIGSFFEYNRLLKKHLREAKNLNEKLHSKEVETKKVKTPDSTITFESESGQDKVSIHSKELLYIQSIENYVEIFWKDGSSISNKLLRGSLVRFEKKLDDYDYLFRCHRSFIVNLNQIESVTGNSQGYKLYIYNDETAIPVSRSKSKEINKLINIADYKNSHSIPSIN